MPSHYNLGDFDGRLSKSAERKLESGYNSKPYSYMGFNQQMIDFFGSVPDKISEAKELDERLRKNQVKGEEVYGAYDNMVSQMVADPALAGKLAELYGIQPEDTAALKQRAMSGFTPFEEGVDAQKYYGNSVHEFKSFLEQVQTVGIDQQVVATLGMSTPTSNVRSESEVEKSRNIANNQNIRHYDETIANGPAAPEGFSPEESAPAPEWTTTQLDEIGKRNSVNAKDTKLYGKTYKNEVAREASKTVTTNSVLIEKQGIEALYTKARTPEGLDGSGPLSEDVIAEIAKQHMNAYREDANARAAQNAVDDAEYREASNNLKLANQITTNAKNVEQLEKLLRDKSEVEPNKSGQYYLDTAKEQQKILDKELAKEKSKQDPDRIAALKKDISIRKGAAFDAEKNGGTTPITEVKMEMDLLTPKYALINATQAFSEGAPSKKLEEIIEQSGFNIKHKVGEGEDIKYYVYMSNVSGPDSELMYIYDPAKGTADVVTGQAEAENNPFGEGKNFFGQDPEPLQAPTQSSTTNRADLSFK